MIEPRAIVADDNGHAIAVWVPVNKPPIKVGDGLVTVADVLAALRQPSDAMLEALHSRLTGDDEGIPVHSKRRYRDAFLAMLDQFERDQGSAT